MQLSRLIPKCLLIETSLRGSDNHDILRLLSADISSVSHYNVILHSHSSQCGSLEQIFSVSKVMIVLQHQNKDIF